MIAKRRTSPIAGRARDAEGQAASARPTASSAASATRGASKVGSLLLGLYNDEGQLDHVGFTSALHGRGRPALTRGSRRCAAAGLHRQGARGAEPLEHRALDGEWEPLQPELVVEVRYDQVTGGRFRHGTGFLRWRPDKAPGQCTFEQLAAELRPSELKELFGS